ncbi:MAG: hypothetical protein Kow0042_17650 [Calditrichia bacterium]
MMGSRNKNILSALLCILIWLSIGSSQSASVTISAAEIESHLQKYIEGIFQPRHIRYETRQVREIPSVTLLQQPDQITVGHKGDEVPGGYEVFKVTFYREGNPLRSLYIPVEIRVFQKVWVTSRPVEKDEKLSATNIHLEEKETSSLSGMAYSESESPANLYARRTLPANKIILKSDVREAYLVRQGESADLEYQNGAIKIHLKTIALQNGEAHELIWVKNPENHKRIRVRVVSANTVTLP